MFVEILRIQGEVVLFTLSLLPIENKCGGVYAIAQSGRFRAIVEDMTEMGFASVTKHLDAFHAMSGVHPFDHTIRLMRLPEAGPATAGFKLHPRIK